MLEISNVTLRVKKKTIIDGVSISVQDGGFYGLLGAGGTGKSALLKMCAGLWAPDSGCIEINGADILGRESRRTRVRLVGYMGQQDGYFPRLQVMEYMEVYAHALGMSGLSAREHCMEFLSFAGLEKKADQLVEDQPAGIRRELSLLRAVLHRPRLLLLDDPFAGTDSAQRLVMEELIVSLADDGTTILMASQSLAQMVRLCSEVGVLEGGRLIVQGEIDEVMRHARSEAPVYMQVSGSTDLAVAMLKKEPLVKTISRDGRNIVIRFSGDVKEEAQLLARLTQGGVNVYSFYRGQSSLEDLLEHQLAQK